MVYDDNDATTAAGGVVADAADGDCIDNRYIHCMLSYIVLIHSRLYIYYCIIPLI